MKCCIIKTRHIHLIMQDRKTMDRLYYTYLIIKESLDYIPAIEIKGQLEEKYRIKVDVKTVYQAIKILMNYRSIFIKKKSLRLNIVKAIQ